MKYITFFIVFFIALNVQCIAQKDVSRLQVKDFTVSESLSLQNNKGQNPMLFVVLIDSISNADKVCFNIGSMRDGKDILAIAAKVAKVGNEYVVIYNGKNYPVKNFTISIPVYLNNIQNAKSVIATFYAEDNSKKITEKLYHKIK